MRFGEKERHYLLLHSGYLVGPFDSRIEAIRWAAVNSVRAYSTYEPVTPVDYETALTEAT